MAIPEEDRGPVWLRDYGTGSGIEADIAEMSDFAQKLISEIQDNYLPHANLVFADMQGDQPQPADLFAEHMAFLQSHHDAMTATTDNVYWYIEGTTRLGNAAAEVSARYANADAFSAAQAADVLKALDDAGASSSSYEAH